MSEKKKLKSDYLITLGKSRGELIMLFWVMREMETIDMQDLFVWDTNEIEEDEVAVGYLET